MGNWEEVVDELSVKKQPDIHSTPDQKGIDKALVVDSLLDLKNENSPGHASFSLKKIRKQTMNIIEKEVISHVLNQTGWNRTKASSILKISYKTMLYKISDLNIKPPSK